jgi:hypothetical protein
VITPDLALTAAALALTGLIILTVAMTEPGCGERLATWPTRFRHGYAYHRDGGRHATRADPDATTPMPMPALTTTPDGGPFAARTT